MNSLCFTHMNLGIKSQNEKPKVVVINSSNLTIRSKKLIRPQLLRVLCFTHMSRGIKHETHTKKSYKSFAINLIISLHTWKPCYQCFQQYYKYNNINPSRKKTVINVLNNTTNISTSIHQGRRMMCVGSKNSAAPAHFI